MHDKPRPYRAEQVAQHVRLDEPRPELLGADLQYGRVTVQACNSTNVKMHVYSLLQVLFRNVL